MMSPRRTSRYGRQVAGNRPRRRVDQLVHQHVIADQQRSHHGGARYDEGLHQRGGGEQQKDDVTVHSAMKPPLHLVRQFGKAASQVAPPLLFSVSTAIIVTNETRGNPNGYNSGLTPRWHFSFPARAPIRGQWARRWRIAGPPHGAFSKRPTTRSAFHLSRLSFEGPEDQLKLTENTQPALLTVSMAAFAVLQEQGFRPDYVAGHSWANIRRCGAGVCGSPTPSGWVRRRGR